MPNSAFSLSFYFMVSFNISPSLILSKSSLLSIVFLNPAYFHLFFSLFLCFSNGCRSDIPRHGFGVSLSLELKKWNQVSFCLFFFFFPSFPLNSSFFSEISSLLFLLRKNPLPETLFFFFSSCSPSLATLIFTTFLLKLLLNFFDFQLPTLFRFLELNFYFEVPLLLLLFLFPFLHSNIFFSLLPSWNRSYYFLYFLCS